MRHIYNSIGAAYWLAFNWLWKGLGLWVYGRCGLRLGFSVEYYIGVHILGPRWSFQGRPTPRHTIPAKPYSMGPTSSTPLVDQWTFLFDCVRVGHSKRKASCLNEATLGIIVRGIMSKLPWKSSMESSCFACEYDWVFSKHNEWTDWNIRARIAKHQTWWIHLWCPQSGKGSGRDGIRRAYIYANEVVVGERCRVGVLTYKPHLRWEPLASASKSLDLESNKVCRSVCPQHTAWSSPDVNWATTCQCPNVFTIL